MTKLNLYQKLVEVRKVVPYLQKSAKGQQYDYVSSSMVLGGVRQKLDELGVLLITEITNKTVHAREKQTKGGSITIEYALEADLQFTWVNAESPDEKIVIPFFSMGLDSGDNAKAVGKMLTYGEKYFLMKQFNIATDKDDPDRFQEKAENSQREVVSNDQVNNFLTLADTFATLRNQTRDAVLKALHIKDVSKLSTKQLNEHTVTLNTWIEKAKQAS